MLLGGHQVPPASVRPFFETVQESEYAAIRETETCTDLSREEPIEERMPGTIEEEISHSAAYSDLLVREDPPSHYYTKLLSPIKRSCELHPYVNVPVMVDLSTSSEDIRLDGNIQQ